jgi:hypothetical protein
MRFGEHWLVQALLAMWIALVTLLHYGLLADNLLTALAKR